MMNVTEILDGGYCGTIDRFSDRTGVVVAHELCAVGRVFLECVAGFLRACINQPHEMLALTVLSSGCMFIMSLIMVPVFFMLLSEIALYWGFVPRGFGPEQPAISNGAETGDDDDDDDDGGDDGASDESDGQGEEGDKDDATGSEADEDRPHSYDGESSDAEEILRETGPDVGEWESCAYPEDAADGRELLDTASE